MNIVLHQLRRVSLWPQTQEHSSSLVFNMSLRSLPASSSNQCRQTDLVSLVELLVPRLLPLTRCRSLRYPPNVHQFEPTRYPLTSQWRALRVPSTFSCEWSENYGRTTPDAEVLTLWKHCFLTEDVMSEHEGGTDWMETDRNLPTNELIRAKMCLSFSCVSLYGTTGSGVVTAVGETVSRVTLTRMVKTLNDIFLNEEVLPWPLRTVLYLSL